jgi:hypothetical protein
VKFEGEWIRLEDYLKRRFGVSVSHGLSKAAAAKMIQEIRRRTRPQIRRGRHRDDGVQLNL